MSSVYIAKTICNIVWKRSAETYLGKLCGNYQHALSRSSVRWNSTSENGLSYYNASSTTPLLSVTVPEMVDNALQCHKNSLAVVDCEQNIRKTYSEYIADIDKLAAGLVTLGLKKGDRLGIWSTNSYQWLTTQFACAKTGIILVCLNPLFQAKELESCLKFTGVKVLFVAEKLRDFSLYKILEQIIPNLSQNQSGKVTNDKLPDLESVVMFSDNRYPGTYRYLDVFNAGKPGDYLEVENMKKTIQTFDPLHLAFTSGTTGVPKAVVVNHHATVNGIRYNSADLFIDKNAKLCNCAPFFHAMGTMVGGYTNMHVGSALIIPSAAYSASSVIAALNGEKCTIVAGTPTMFFDIWKNAQLQKLDFPFVNFVCVAGSPVPLELKKHLRQKFTNAHVLSGYAATETTAGLMLQKAPHNTPDGTVGRLMDHMEVRVVDDHGRLVPWNTPGELQFRGFLIMPGYWKSPEKTAATMTPDGFYKSGDVGVFSADGVGRIVGRIKDMIIRGGENIYPSEIEDHLATHPKILEAHILGVPDERLGEKVCAWIMLAEGHQMSADEVKQFCTGNLAAFKVPAVVKFAMDVPRLPTGKVDKLLMKNTFIEPMN